MRLYCRPKSRRLIVVVADAPTRCWPFCPFRIGDGPSTSSVTSLVTPWSVRSPINLNLPGLPGSTRLDLNVSVGYFAISKKLGDLRSASRLSLPVVTAVTSIVMSALMLWTDVPSYSMVPVIFPSVPRTVDTIRCLTLKCAALCAGSTFQAPGAPAAACAGGWAPTGWTTDKAATAARSNLNINKYSRKHEQWKCQLAKYAVE